MMRLTRLLLLPIGFAALCASAAAQDASTSGDPALDAILNGPGFYFEMRDAILAEGWKPVVSPQCGADVYGSPEIQPKAGEFDVCAVLPELESCSGQGYCLVSFKNKAGLVVRITVYGSYGEDWNDTDYDPMFVLNWEADS